MECTWLGVFVVALPVTTVCVYAIVKRMQGEDFWY